MTTMWFLKSHNILQYGWIPDIFKENNNELTMYTERNFSKRHVELQIKR